MTDAFDQASNLEVQFTEIALANQLAVGRQRLQRVSAIDCIECGNSIPEKRRHAVSGCQFCIHCQELAEKGKL